MTYLKIEDKIYKKGKRKGQKMTIDVKRRKVIYCLFLIIKDTIKLLANCLIATILCSICIENGWILQGNTTEISHDMFWKLYSAIFVLVPLILFYRGLMGHYRVEIKEVNIENSLGKAKLSKF